MRRGCGKEVIDHQGTTGTVVHVFRRLLTPRWLGMLLAAFVFAAACVQLGRWQFGRHEQRSAYADRVDTHYSAPARPITDVITNQSLKPDDDWTAVTLSGSYRPDPIFVRNRTNNGEPGTEVLGVLDVPALGAVLVDLGYALAGGDARELPAVASLPSGRTDLTGWVRLPEASRGRELPAGQLASITPADAEPAVGPLLDFYVRAKTPLTGLAELEAPSTSLGPHLAYAIQWWLTTVAGFAFVWFGIKRELQEEALANPAGTAGPTRPAVRRRSPSLEDEEDAELDRHYAQE